MFEIKNFKSIKKLRRIHLMVPKKYYVLYVFILLLPTISQSNSENIKFNHITTNNGLSQNSVKCITQDYLGFMWFGTNDGLNKFDGNSFTIYKNIHGQKNSITDNNISYIYEDKDQTLWVSSNQGVSYYNREKDLFIPIDSLRIHYINNIFELDDEYLYFLSYTNFLRYDKKTGEVTSLFDGMGIIGTIFFTGGIIQYKKDILLVTTPKGLYLYDLKTNTVKPANIVNLENANDIYMQKIFSDSFGNIWIGTRGSGLLLLKHETESIDALKLHKIKAEFNATTEFNVNAVEAIQEDEDGFLWIGTRDAQGIFMLDLKKFKKNEVHFTKIQNLSNQELNLNSDAIAFIYKDRNGTLWVGHNLTGLSYYNKLSSKFQVIQHNRQDEGLNSNYVNCILEEPNYLWIGTDKGLNRFNRKTKEWKYYSVKTKKGTHSITVLYRDSKKNLWAGTWAGGLNLLNEKTGVFKTYLHNSNDTSSIISNNIFGITEDRKGQLWIGTMDGGVCIYNYEFNTFNRVLNKKGKEKIQSKWIKNMITDSYGNILIASGNGLYVQDYKNDTIYHFTNNINNPYSLPSNLLVSIFEDSKGSIWIGTENGLCKYNINNNKFITFSEKEGLPNNVIRSISDDNNGNLWIATNMGLSKFVNAVNNPDTIRFVNYNTSDGLLDNEFNSRASFKGEDGTVYFGSAKGLVYFMPNSMRRNNTPPEIIFTDFLLFNESMKIGNPKTPLKKDITLTKEITLNHNQSVISFKYVALNFIASEKNNYKYMMKGFDLDWNEVGSKKEATYTNLNPGNYEFVVIASNNDGVWNTKGNSIRLTILPPWWNTLWFKTLVILLILGVIVAVYYLRINRLKKQKIVLQNLVQQRTAEIKGKNDILKKQTDELNVANIQLRERQERVLEQAEELSRKNKDLEILNSTKDKFFSIIAHDLKNPFSSIIGLTSLIKVKYHKYTDEKRIEINEMIHDSANRSFKLLENLLEWAQAQTGNIKFNPEAIFFNEIISDLETLLKNSLDDKNLTIKCIAPKDFHLFADKNMITTILRNLITNALKFSENGTITVLVKDDDRFSTINVTDEGVGMSEDKTASIFKIEKSNSTTGTQGEKGTGLGLIICKEFIEYHEGSIKVQSTEGIGSTFTIIIPKKQ